MDRRLGVFGAMVLGAAALCGCSASFNGLVRESEVGDLAPLRTLTAAHPNHTLLVESSPEGEPSVRLAVHEIGDGSHEWTLVLLHGMFSDSSSWRFVQGALAEDHDLLVIDMPGCGTSDAPDPGPGSGDLYTPGGVARRVLAVVRERLSHRSVPPRIAIVGHSYGGMIAMRMFAESSLAAEYSDVLGRVERLVLISPVDVSVRPDPVFIQIATVSALKINLGMAFGVVHDKVVAATMRSVPEGRPALREEAEKRLEVLRDTRRRRAMQALLLNAVPITGADRRPDWAEMERLERGYARVTPSTLILWGRRDETVPISMGYKIASQLPHSTLVPIDHCMHSPHIERPRWCADVIADFTRTGVPPLDAP